MERASDRFGVEERLSAWLSALNCQTKHQLHATLRSSSTQTRTQRCANRKRSVATSAPGYLWTTAFIISCVTFSKWKQQWKVRSHRRFLRMCTVVRHRWLCSLKLIIQLAGKWICWGICDICDICITLIECSFFPPLNMHHKVKSLLILLTMRQLEFTAAKDRTKVLASRASLLGKEQQRGFA